MLGCVLGTGTGTWGVELGRLMCVGGEVRGGMREERGKGSGGGVERRDGYGGGVEGLAMAIWSGMVGNEGSEWVKCGIRSTRGRVVVKPLDMTTRTKR